MTSIAPQEEANNADERPDMDHFDELMELGVELLKKGDYNTAAGVFMLATGEPAHEHDGWPYSTAANPSHACAALNQAAIAYSKMGKNKDAYWCISRAALYASGPDDTTRINRDKAMILIALDPEKNMREALALTHPTEQPPGVSKLELWATNGFHGRLLVMNGELYQKGIMYMMNADQMLRQSDNREYEMNNLIALIAALDAPPLDPYVVRAIRLAYDLGYTERLIEILLLGVGGEKLHSIGLAAVRRATTIRGAAGARAHQAQNTLTATARRLLTLRL